MTGAGLPRFVPGLDDLGRCAKQEEKDRVEIHATGGGHGPRHDATEGAGLVGLPVRTFG
jgi:hypothetical protein